MEQRRSSVGRRLVMAPRRRARKARRVGLKQARRIERASGIVVQKIILLHLRHHKLLNSGANWNAALVDLVHVHFPVPHHKQ
jgi:hypothetical protein